MKLILFILVIFCFTGCFDIPALIITPNDYNDSSTENLIDSVLEDSSNLIILTDSNLITIDDLPELQYLSTNLKKWYFRSYSGGYSFTGNWGGAHPVFRDAPRIC